MVIAFGDSDESKAFTKRNQTFFDHFPVLRAEFENCLVRSIADTSIADRVIFFLGRLCFEDLMEVLLLASSGYGYGALKLVRGLYERAVVCTYLVSHPDRTEDFLDYARVEQVKGLRAWVDAYPDDERGTELLKRAIVRYEEVKDRFPKGLWSGLDFVSMAKSTGSLGKLLGEAYYAPLSQAHGTAQSVVARLIWTEQSGFEFDPGPNSEQADEALQLAHKIMLYVLGTQHDHFWPGKSSNSLQAALDAFVLIWKKDH